MPQDAFTANVVEVFPFTLPVEILSRKRRASRSHGVDCNVLRPDVELRWSRYSLFHHAANLSGVEVMHHGQPIPLSRSWGDGKSARH
eukprot:12067247-Alexandrium_andersonii.AAC.1